MDNPIDAKRKSVTKYLERENGGFGRKKGKDMISLSGYILNLSGWGNGLKRSISKVTN